MTDYESFFAKVSPGWDPFTATEPELDAWLSAGQPTWDEMPGALTVNVPKIFSGVNNGESLPPGE